MKNPRCENWVTKLGPPRNERVADFSERAEHGLAVHDRCDDTSREQLLRRDLHDIFGQHDEVGQLPGRDGAEDVFGERRVCRVERHAYHSMCENHGSMQAGLRWTCDVARNVYQHAASNGRDMMRKHWYAPFSASSRVMRCSGNLRRKGQQARANAYGYINMNVVMRGGWGKGTYQPPGPCGDVPSRERRVIAA